MPRLLIIILTHYLMITFWTKTKPLITISLIKLFAFFCILSFLSSQPENTQKPNKTAKYVCIKNSSLIFRESEYRIHNYSLVFSRLKIGISACYIFKGFLKEFLTYIGGQHVGVTA